MNKIEDKEFNIERFTFEGYPTKQWSVRVRRTWDDGHGYKGEAWRDIKVFNSKSECEEWVKNKSLININF